jgi:DNA modification methylase
MDSNFVDFGDCRDSMRRWVKEGVRAQTCVTSPPYYGLRNYGHDGQLGLEETPEQYIAAMVEVFQCVRDVLEDDGTLWLNIGDSYGKDKQMFGIPWRVALALQSDGWVLRQDIIWHKPNPMPGPAHGKCVPAHEYLFLLAKNSSYFFDHLKIREKSSGLSGGGFSKKHIENRLKHGAVTTDRPENDGFRNKRSVWSVPVHSYKGAHFATFPPALIEPCILAGSRPNDIVLDPFMGSGTTAVVAVKHGRRYIGCELNEEYGDLQDERIRALA